MEPVNISPDRGYPNIQRPGCPAKNRPHRTSTFSTFLLKNRPMIEIQEDKTHEEIDSSPQAIDEEWKKYNKRLDDLIDDAEIEAEIEAERTIRSKNSRLVTISAVGFALLALIFFQIQQRSNSPEPIINETLVEQTAFFPQETPPVVPPADQLAPAIPAPIAKSTTKTSTKPKNVAPRVIGKTAPKINKTVKTAKSTSVTPGTRTSGGPHYVQLGAFSIKGNAEKFSKKIAAKGFKPSISVRNTQSTRHQVTIGSFSEKINAEPKLAELKISGFNPSIKRVDNAYTLVVGLFRKDKQSSSIVDKLQGRGFQPITKRVSVEGKTYIVRVEGLATEKEARQTRQKLARLGFKNSFIR